MIEKSIDPEDEEEDGGEKVNFSYRFKFHANLFEGMTYLEILLWRSG